MSKWKRAEILIIRQCAGKMRVAATTWCVGPKETYDKFTGRRVGAPLTKRRLKLESIKPIEGGVA
ncbi:hypothetical protein ISI31_000644 [Salmonella enterica]|nr:hypothetical protein [Salmonella enterica]